MSKHSKNMKNEKKFFNSIKTITFLLYYLEIY